MKTMDFVVWQEGKYFVAQCINVNVSSFGETRDEALANLTEAVELYFEGENLDLPTVGEVIVGRQTVNV